MPPKKSYHVELWCSDPREDGDDHCQSYEFEDLASAKRAFENPRDEMRANDLHCVTHLQLTRVVLYDGREYADPIGVRQVMTDAQIAKMRADDDRTWKREIAMEAAMLHGVDAYNEVMGY